MKNSLKTLHPAVSLLFFLTVIVVSAVVKNPIYVSVSLVLSAACVFMCGGKKAILPCLAAGGVFTVFATLLTPAFYRSAAGFLPGLFIGLSGCSVILWFFCAYAAFDGEKFMFLFGRKLPAFAALVNKIFGFLPLFFKTLKSIAKTQRSFGINCEGGKLSQQLKNAKTIFGAALSSVKRQNQKKALAMADNGFGGARTNYSLHTFRLTDAVYLLYLLVFGAFSVVGAVKHIWFEQNIFSAYSILWLFLCLLPFIIYITEVVKCQLYQQKI